MFWNGSTDCGYLSKGLKRRYYGNVNFTWGIKEVFVRYISICIEIESNLLAGGVEMAALEKNILEETKSTHKRWKK